MVRKSKISIYIKPPVDYEFQIWAAKNGEVSV